MKVIVHFIAGLERKIPRGTYGKTAVVELKEGTTVGELLQMLELPEFVFARVNNVNAENDLVFQEGDQVRLLPKIAGG